MELPRPADLARYRTADPGPPTDPKIQHVYYGIVEEGNRIRYFLSDQQVEPWDFPEGREFDPNSNEYRELKLGETQKWVVGTRNGGERELRLMSQKEAMSITKGNNLIIVALVDGDLRFRIFTGNGGERTRHSSMECCNRAPSTGMATRRRRASTSCCRRTRPGRSSVSGRESRCSRACRLAVSPRASSKGRSSPRSNRSPV